jgi:short-subunit dehydrogenase
MPRAESTGAHGARYGLITGASSGIGYELAKLVAADGLHPILAARNEARLNEIRAEFEETYGVKPRVIASDLSDPEAPAEIFRELEEAGIRLEVLINNAGFNVHGAFVESDLDHELAMIRLHIGAVTQLTKLFLRQLPEGRGGMILNVSSIAAFVPGPFVSVHFASRAHTLSFSEALAHELKGSGIHVTCLCPGPTESAFFERANMGTVRLASGWPIGTMSARAAAEAGYRGMKRGKTIVIPGLQNKIIVLLARFLPRPLVLRITRWIMGKRS